MHLNGPVDSQDEEDEEAVHNLTVTKNKLNIYSPIVVIK